MEIDRSNYEIWLVDWLDGNLSELQKEELLLFLKDNPDLREEFNDLSAITLLPGIESFHNKNQLKKAAPEITDSQFGLLCAGYLENDLSENQKSELLEIIAVDSSRNTEFELIQKMKLSPPEISYKYKKPLYKRTAFQNTISISMVGLSAAAAIALLIISAPFSPEKQPGNSLNIAQVSEKDSTVSNKKTEISPVVVLPVEKRKTIAAPVIQKTPEIQYSELVAVNADTLPVSREPEIRKVYFTKKISLNQNSVTSSLIASSFEVIAPYYDDGRSDLRRFFARTFRDKILKDDITKDTPIKGYEIAEAGVSGLNKLLGWEMALDKNSDENGELNSVYFSSKILKFNTPVKKTEPLP